MTRSLKMVALESLGMVSYSHSIAIICSHIDTILECDGHWTDRHHTTALATIIHCVPKNETCVILNIMYSCKSIAMCGDLQTLICVLVARPRRCPTLSNPVP